MVSDFLRDQFKTAHLKDCLLLASLRSWRASIASCDVLLRKDYSFGQIAHQLIFSFLEAFSAPKCAQFSSVYCRLCCQFLSFGQPGLPKQELCWVVASLLAQVMCFDAAGSIIVLAQFLDQ
jgi:hypothetical protein